MALPTYETFNEGKATSTSVVVTKPTGTTTDDLLVGYLSSDGGSETHTSPETDSWTVIYKGQSEGSGKATFSIWYKIAGGSEPANYTFGCGSSEGLYAVVMRIDGSDLNIPIHRKAIATGDSSTVTHPDVTTTTADCLIIRAFGIDHIDIDVDAGWASNTNITADFSDGSGGTGGGSAWENQASAGSPGTEVNTLTGQEEWVAVTIAIRPPMTAPSIDVGALPIDRLSAFSATYTYVDTNNAANDSGTITTVMVWATTNLSDLVVGTFYATNGDTFKCRDSEAIGAVTAGQERTFTGLTITVVTGDYIGYYFTAGTLEGDISGFSGLWRVSGEFIDPNDETTYTALPNYAGSIYGYAVAAGEEKGPVNAAVIIGVLPAASRALAIDRDSIVLIGNLVSATRALSITRSATTLIGNLVSATRLGGITRAATTLIGNLVSATRLPNYPRSASVLIGNLVSATRAITITRSSSILVGVLVTASRILATVKAAIVLIGNLVSATRLPNYPRNALVLIGNLVTATRAGTFTRTSSVIIGNLVSAVRLPNYPRSALVLIGNLISATRATTVTRASIVLVGVKTTASRVVAITRSASVLIGNLVSASKSWGIAVSSSVLVGVLVSATRIYGIVKSASVLIGNLVSASRAVAATRASIVLIGVLSTASRALAITRASSVLVGNLVSASRVVGVIRSSSVLIGNLVSATRAVATTRTSFVIVGVVASASRAIAAIRSSSVIIGAKVSAVVIAI